MPDITDYLTDIREAQYGKDVREAIAAAIEILADSGGGTGLTETAKQYLITILRNGIYKTDQSANITALETALDGGGSSTSTYLVIYSLSSVTSSNSGASVAAGGSYTTTLTPASGAEMSSVSVTMGGTDVTSVVYTSATGVISIPEVTGHIVITAAAASDERTLLYSWDFTDAMTDSVESVAATLGGSAAQSASGVTLTTANDYVKIPGILSSLGRTIELDVTEYDRQGTAHGRLLTWRSSSTGQFDRGFIFRSTGVWAIYDPATWTDGTETDAGAFDGQTVVLKCQSDGSVSVYCGETLIVSGTMTLGSAESSADNVALCIGSANGNSAYNLTVTALRVYEGVD